MKVAWLASTGCGRHRHKAVLAEDLGEAVGQSAVEHRYLPNAGLAM